MRRVFKDQNAWSLTEALCVISLLTLTAGFCVPLADEARRHAAAVRCRYNLRQIGQACATYLSDYDQFPDEAPLDQPTATLRWEEKLYPYVDYVGVFDCPAAKHPWVVRVDKKARNDWVHYQNPDWHGRRIGYGYNGNLSGREPTKEAARILLAADGCHPAFVACPEWMGNPKAVGFLSYPDRCAPLCRELQPNGKSVGRHVRGNQAVFCDGRVEILTREEIAERWPRIVQR